MSNESTNFYEGCDNGYEEQEYNDFERFRDDDESWVDVDNEPDYAALEAEEAYYRSWRGKFLSQRIRIKAFFVTIWRKFFPYKIKQEDIPF